MPEHVRTYHNAAPEMSGPNCWNLALVMAGILPSLRYATNDEMNFYMRPPLCRELSANEPRWPGDIGAIRTSRPDPQDNSIGRSEVHGFVWISDDLVYSKNGATNRRPFAVQAPGPMLSLYQTLSCGDDSACVTRPEMFRCRSMESYLNDPTTRPPSAVRRAFDQLNQADNCISQYAFGFHSLNQSSRRQIVSTVQALAAYFETPEFQRDLRAMPQDQRTFMQASMHLRLESLWSQIDETSRVPSFCWSCTPLSEAIVEANRSLSRTGVN